MIVTETELINRKLAYHHSDWESRMINNLLIEDQLSQEKARMKEGERYYNYEHDILQKDFTAEILEETTENCESDEEETVRRNFRNPNRSNHHNVDSFHHVLVEQKVSYLLSKEPTISVKGSEDDTALKNYETLLSEWSDESLNELLQDLATGASNKGWEAIHFYYDDVGKLQSCIVPAETIIPIYDTVYQNELVELIRYYPIEVYQGETKTLRTKVEWWTKENVTYYLEGENKQYSLDAGVEVNPAPHFYLVTSIDGQAVKREPHSWGRVPFVILKNNKNSRTDLEAIKGLVDAYDLISSEGVNNFLDLVELYWIIQGYGGEAASSIARKLRINRAVSIQDASGGGGVSAHQVELPVAGRIEFLKMLRRDIYHFGQGVDTDTDKFGNAPSGVALKFAYTQLDLKANAMQAKLKRAIKEIFWFLTEDYNRSNHTDYDSSLIKVALNKTMITNDLELVQMITQSKGIVSDKTLLGAHPLVDDVNEELTELEAQEARELDKLREEYFQPEGGAGNEPKQ